MMKIYQKGLSHRGASAAGSLLMALVLAACGGGDGAGGVRDSISVAQSEQATYDSIVADDEKGTVRYAYGTIGGGSLVSDEPLTAEEKKYLKLSQHEIASMTKASSGREQAQAINPAPCKTYRFSGVHGCIQPGPDIISYTGSSVSDIIGVIADCTEVAVGSTYSATTPAPGARACFQYVVEDPATVTNQVILPATVSAATVELFAVLPNTAAFKVALSQSPSNPHNLSAASAFARYVLMVRTADGPGGQPYNIGIGVPANPLPTALNDDPSRPMFVPMNETKTATINPTGQGDFYYFYPTGPGQKTAIFSSTFTTNQTVTYRKASRNSAGVYTLLAEIPYATSNLLVPLNGLVATASGATTTNGVMVRVSKKAPYATVPQSFSLRAGVSTGYLSNFSVWNYEGLTRIYNVASGRQQAATYIGVNLSVRDANNQPVKGEALTVTVFQDETGSPSAPAIEAVTDASGNFTVSPSLTGCPSTATTQENLVSSSPGDHWRMKGQRGKIVLNLPNATPTTPNVGGNIRIIPFYRVCSEIYLGNY